MGHGSPVSWAYFLPIFSLSIFELGPGTGQSDTRQDNITPPAWGSGMTMRSGLALLALKHDRGVELHGRM